MKCFLVLTFALLLPAFVQAHVGSPNVFFEGQAGSYPLRVIVRPPAVLPGVAQVDARVGVDGVTNVWLQAILFEAGKEGGPSPVRAVSVAGETNLFNGALWLLRAGSYSVEVTVESHAGRGSLIVPVNSAATKRPSMPPWLAVLLVFLAVILFGSAVWLAGAAARDCALPPGAPAAIEASRSARVVTFAAALVLGVALCAGALRWQRMDREFRNNALYKPLPIAANISTNGTLKLLDLKAPVSNNGSSGWDTLVADHGKLMHLFLLREPDFNAFAHLHPVRRDNRTFQNVLPPLPEGEYQLYGEITHENGLNDTLTAKIHLPAPTGRPLQMTAGSNMLVFCQSALAPPGSAPQPFALDADDSWHLGAGVPAQQSAPSPLMGGWRLLWQNQGDLIENREASLRFALFTPEGSRAELQPYMGMFGHAVVRRSDGEVFTHLHPLGTISMATQELFERRERGLGSLETNTPSVTSQRWAANNAARPNEVAFPYAFPRPGDYRMWVQVRTSGRVLTGVFDLKVKPAR